MDSIRKSHQCTRTKDNSTRAKVPGCFHVRQVLHFIMTIGKSSGFIWLIASDQGYYMNKDVFGQAGDFIISPEIIQVFGELVGVWFVNQWMISGKKKLQFVELGPGRGTLASDVLQVFGKLAELLNYISLHLIEVGPALSEIQESTLTGGSHNDNKKEKESGETRITAFENEVGSDLCYERCITQAGILVSWYRAIQDVPLEENTFFLAHEFFDALPVHQFQKTDQGWREVPVDVMQEQGCKVVFEKADSSEAQALQSGYKMLTIPSEMEDKFQIFSLVQNGQPRPAAFR